MRGTHDFYNKPWYDSVEYHGTNGAMQYGRVMCILQLQRCRKRRRRGNQQQQDDDESADDNSVGLRVAVVQRMQKTTTTPAVPGSLATVRQHLVAAGCTHVQFTGTKMRNEVCVVDHQYDLIPVDEIVRRVYIVPDYTSLDRAGNTRYYFVNHFKYDRGVKDSRTIADKEGDLYEDGVLQEDL